MGQELGFALGEGLTAGYGAWQQNQARKFQERRLEQAMQIAQMQNEIRLMTAHLAAGSRERVANTSAEARRYAADAGYDAADRRSAATKYAADQGLKGHQYSADMGYAAADRRSSATEHAADQGVAGRRITAGATRDAANIGASSRERVAGIAARSRDRATKAGAERGKMSLYGTLFKPRPQSQLSDEPPAAPPNFGQWQQSQGFGSTFDDGGDDDPNTDDQQDDAAALDDQDDDPNAEPDVEPPVMTVPPPARQPATQPRAGVLPPMRPVPSHGPAGTTRPQAAAPNTPARQVSSANLDAFAKATNRTRQQAEKYAADHGWTIGQ